MGFKQFGAFVESTTLASDELLSFDTGVLTEGGDLFEDLLFGLEAQVFG